LLNLPNGNQIEIKDISPRQLVVPVGTTLRVPEGHNWLVRSVTVLPTTGYTPPLGVGEARDLYVFGDLSLRVGENKDDSFCANVLTLMDRYWGRHNLNPHLYDAAMKLQQAQHAVFTAPTIPELQQTLGKARECLTEYLTAASPLSDSPVLVRGPADLHVRHVHRHANTLLALDVELLLMINRPIG
jgi:hypothetical protein